MLAFCRFTSWMVIATVVAGSIGCQSVTRWGARPAIKKSAPKIASEDSPSLRFVQPTSAEIPLDEPPVYEPSELPQVEPLQLEPLADETTSTALPVEPQNFEPVTQTSQPLYVNSPQVQRRESGELRPTPPQQQVAAVRVAPLLIDPSIPVAAPVLHQPNRILAGQPQRAPELPSLPPLVDPEFDPPPAPIGVTPPPANPTTTPVEQIPPPVQGDETYSLLELEEIAFDANPAVAAALSQVEALRGKWVQAGLKPNPTIGYAGEDIGIDGTAGKHGIFIGQQFVRGNKLALHQQVVMQEITKAEQHLAAVRQRVATDVHTGYYDVLIAQRKVELANELVEIGTESVKASQALVDAKEISTVGLLQAQVESEQAAITARRATAELQAAWRQLSAVLGRPGLLPRRLVGDLVPSGMQLDWQEQVDRLSTSSPEIAAAVAELSRAQAELVSARAEVISDVDVELAVQYDDDTEDTVTGIQIGMPIPIWNKNQGNIRRARSEIAVAQQQMQRIELDLRRRLAAAFETYSQASYEVQKYSGEILPKAQRTYELVSIGFKAGEIGYLDMLTAQRTYSQTNLAYIVGLRELWQARLHIEGFLLDGSLQQ